MTINEVQMIRAGGPREGPVFRTYSSFDEIRAAFKKIDMKLAGNLISYVLNKELVIPTNPVFGGLPPGAKLLPVNNAALKNIVTHFAGDHPEASDNEMTFLKGAINPPGVISVGARGTALSLPYMQNTGKPLGA
jgi:hypothetical protein